MPYVDDVWVPNRIIESLGDPYKIAAEQLAKHVETFLYDTASPAYANTSFLAWCVAQYDAAKTGSGRPIDVVEWDRAETEAVLQPVLPPSERVSPSGTYDGVTRFPDEARQAGYVPDPAA